MLEARLLSVVPFISSFHCSSANNFAIVARDRRSTGNGGTPTVLALSTLSKNDCYSVQLQHEHTNMTLMARATDVRHKICCCTVARASAESFDFLAIYTRSCVYDQRSTVVLQAFSHLQFFQRTTDNTCSSSTHMQTQH